jgi:hypothetical protein
MFSQSLHSIGDERRRTYLRIDEALTGLRVIYLTSDDD